MVIGYSTSSQKRSGPLEGRQDMNVRHLMARLGAGLAFVVFCTVAGQLSAYGQTPTVGIGSASGAAGDEMDIGVVLKAVPRESARSSSM